MLKYFNLQKQMRETMMDYTKYRLKPKDELDDVLKEVSSLFVIWCKKCYKVFETEEFSECDNFVELISGKDKINGCLGIDFLCNRFLTEKKIQNLPENSPIGIISCGLGIQTVAKLVENKRIRVIALADSVPQSDNATSIIGYHGIALGSEKCAGCAQCYLGMTGGLCPIVDCAKSLLNGPCGGAKDSKCEVNAEKDCVWIEIFKRMEKQKRTISYPVKVRDYNKFGSSEEKKISTISFARRTESFYGGVHPSEKKELTENLPVQEFPSSKYLFVFLSQHAGYPATALVKQGNIVKYGQKIAESSGLISASVHSPVSGKVVSIEEKTHPALLRKMPAVVIENDFSDEKDEMISGCADWQSAPKEKLTELVKEKGIVGLGGAMFPTHVKFFPPKKPIDVLIVNGCECEPYLNADNRLMIEHPEEILHGIMIARKVLGVSSVVVAIEENKPDAIESMKKAIGEKQGFVLKEMKTKYPQGAEKMLIKSTLGRRVPDGGLPLDVGVVVLNVGTIFSIYRAIVQGLPLVKRMITVSGEFEKQGNLEIRIGTPFTDIFEFCKSKISENKDEYCLKMGGPMMGIMQTDFDSAVIKGTTGMILTKKPLVDCSQQNTCIKCGRCVDVCPMELYPLYYAYYGSRQMWEKCVEYGVKNCIECGCCQYVCSSKIALVDLIKQAKKNANNKT